MRISAVSGGGLDICGSQPFRELLVDLLSHWLCLDLAERYRLLIVIGEPCGGWPAALKVSQTTGWLHEFGLWSYHVVTTIIGEPLRIWLSLRPVVICRVQANGLGLVDSDWEDYIVPWFFVVDVHGRSMLINTQVYHSAVVFCLLDGLLLWISCYEATGSHLAGYCAHILLVTNPHLVGYVIQPNHQRRDKSDDCQMILINCTSLQTTIICWNITNHRQRL